MTEKQVIRLENVLILVSIAALWPAILRWPARVALPSLAGALAAMIVINVNRWRRLLRLKRRQRCGDGNGSGTPPAP